MDETHLTSNGVPLKDSAPLIRDNIVMNGTPLKRTAEEINRDQDELRSKQQSNASVTNTSINFGFSHSKQNSFIPNSPISNPTQRTSNSGRGASMGDMRFFCYKDGEIGTISIGTNSSFSKLK